MEKILQQTHKHCFISTISFYLSGVIYDRFHNFSYIVVLDWSQTNPMHDSSPFSIIGYIWFTNLRHMQWIPKRSFNVLRWMFIGYMCLGIVKRSLQLNKCWCSYKKKKNETATTKTYRDSTLQIFFIIQIHIFHHQINSDSVNIKQRLASMCFVFFFLALRSWIRNDCAVLQVQ